MLLAREFLGFLSRQLVARLTPATFEVSNPAAAADAIAHIIDDDLSLEDRLNDEVRELLEEYSEYMRRENVSYQEMFRKIKKQLLAQRKVLPASGRDTGDSMKLSRDKINDLSHKIVSALRKIETFEFAKIPMRSGLLWCAKSPMFSNWRIGSIGQRVRRSRHKSARSPKAVKNTTCCTSGITPRS